MAKWSEGELIRYISEIFAKANSDLIVGIGDDAAVVAAPSAPLVVTTDMAVEDVHFKSAWSSASEIGQKIAAANLADILAMGGTPRYLTVAMSATGDEELEWLLDIARGISRETQKVGAQVIGGDLSRGSKIVISITAIGELVDRQEPVLRSGAEIGDEIVISGLPGWSAAGLIALQRGLSGDLLDQAIARHKVPEIDYQFVKFFSHTANSLCDISDSLLIQGEQIASASGVQLEIDGDLIAKHPQFAALTKIANLLGVSVFDLALSGGEDHVFLATRAPSPTTAEESVNAVNQVSAHVIGKVREGSGVRLLHVATPQPGWQHF